MARMISSLFLASFLAFSKHSNIVLGYEIMHAFLSIHFMIETHVSELHKPINRSIEACAHDVVVSPIFRFQSDARIFSRSSYRDQSVRHQRARLICFSGVLNSLKAKLVSPSVEEQ